MPQASEEATISRAPVLISAKPGRSTSSTPANPAAKAVMRRARMTSPSSSTASRLPNSGAEKDSAVTSASGIIVTPVKKASIPPACTAPRSAWRCSFPVRRGAAPRRRKIGASASRPNRLRKNATSKGGSASPISRTIVCIPVKQSVVATISDMPWTTGGRAWKRASIRPFRSGGRQT